MPQGKRVASLFHLCINYISVNMDKWSLVNTPNDTNINSDLSDLSGGLFNQLCKQRIDEIILNVSVLYGN